MGPCGAPCSCIVAFPLTSSSHSLLFLENNDVAKRLSPFDVWKVPQSQKHKKTRKSALQCENQMKGDCLENPQNQWQTSLGPYKNMK
jgi:hypothetical protein